jgi:pimeloyl-ACP methyl ester carboxylesterase
VAATFVPIHAAGDGAWNWRLVAAELRARDHDAVMVDLPAGDPSAGLWDYADLVVEAIGERTNIVVVAHSFGAFTAPLVCARVACDALVLVSGMIPAPGEAPMDWWANTGHAEAQRSSGGGGDDITTFYHDVPPELAAEAMRRERDHPSERAYTEPWPLDAWPKVRTHFVLCRDDRFLPAAWMRRLVRDRLGITPDEIDGGHCPNLSRPAELARQLAAYITPAGERKTRARGPRSPQE